MSWMVVKLGDDEYTVWSTVVDAPVSYAMTREEIASWYVAEQQKEARDRALREIPGAIARADEHGTSSRLGHTIEELLAVNRENGTRPQTMKELRAACRAPREDQT